MKARRSRLRAVEGALAWILLGACSVVDGPASAAPVDTNLLGGLGDTRYHRHESSALGRPFHLFVRLPEGYAEHPERRFPTVYLLDGGVTFPLLSGYYRYLSLGEEVPESILVGISYGTDDWRQGNMRGTDYTAKSEERDFWGGAPQFQKVLAQEILPWVEGQFRSDPDRRVIFGQSLGGQFVLYTAQTDPGLFWGHIASNPALHRNLPFFLETAPDPEASFQARLFVSSGSDDVPRFREPALKWIEHWSGKGSTPWALKTLTLDGENHFSAVAPAFRQGMLWVFAGGGADAPPTADGT